MSAFTGTTALWYASRATGTVSIVLLTIVMLLGVGVSGRRTVPGLPKFVVLGLHRNASLLAVAFLAVHIVTAVADPYVAIKWADAVIPFTSGYQPLGLGLGVRRVAGRAAARHHHRTRPAQRPAARSHSGVCECRGVRRCVANQDQQP